MCLMPYANNKDADQPAHPCSLISMFVVHCLDSTICILAISKVSRLYLVSIAEQAGLSLNWSKIPEDKFLRGVAHIVCLFVWCHFALQDYYTHFRAKCNWEGCRSDK